MKRSLQIFAFVAAQFPLLALADSNDTPIRVPVPVPPIVVPAAFGAEELLGTLAASQENSPVRIPGNIPRQQVEAAFAP